MFQRTWQRPPTQGELDGLIDDHIREEVLVREALALGLDRDDVIIRRRLRQKMEFLSDESASRLKPSERQLRAQLEADPDAYRRDGRISFRQIFLDPSERGEDLRREATELLSGLNGADAAPDPAEVGDSLALLPSRLDQAPRSEVTSLFGRSFADQLFQQKPGSWSGPLESGYGLHLVRIEAITPGDIPPLEDVRLQVERDWQSQQRREQGEKRYRSLLGKYNVRRPEINAAGQEQAP